MWCLLLDKYFSRFIGQGSRYYLEAISLLFLATALFAIGASVNQARLNRGLDHETFPSRWARLGGLVGTLALLTFALELVGIAEMAPTRGPLKVAFLINAVNSVVFLPTWLIWFGIELPRVQALNGKCLASRVIDDTSGAPRNRE